MIEKDDTVAGEAGAVNGFVYDGGLRSGGDDGFGGCIDQRMAQFFGAIAGIDRADDTADGQGTPDQRGQVNGIRGEDDEHVAGLPGPFELEVVAEVEGALADLLEGEAAVGERVDEEGCMGLELLISGMMR